MGTATEFAQGPHGRTHQRYGGMLLEPIWLRIVRYVPGATNKSHTVCFGGKNPSLQATYCGGAVTLITARASRSVSSVPPGKRTQALARWPPSSPRAPPRRPEEALELEEARGRAGEDARGRGGGAWLSPGGRSRGKPAVPAPPNPFKMRAQKQEECSGDHKMSNPGMVYGVSVCAL